MAAQQKGSVEIKRKTAGGGGSGGGKGAKYGQEA